mmetsp:Transcript_6319/g.17185  ORF Transcript_6319/g.17185 Transcript_6319/m.17185 type:complete len:119 (-) Transcript_6319:1008-1364(-)
MEYSSIESSSLKWFSLEGMAISLLRCLSAWLSVGWLVTLFRHRSRMDAHTQSSAMGRRFLGVQMYGTSAYDTKCSAEHLQGSCGTVESSSEGTLASLLAFPHVLGMQQIYFQTAGSMA